MSKTVWILNHYAGPPGVVPHLRHYNFAKYLKRAGYDVKVFISSAIHNSEKNLIENPKTRYSENEMSGVSFVVVRTRQYRGNRADRVLNMLDYYRGVLNVARKLSKPDVILASSAHPLTCVAGLKLAKRFEIPCICEVRDLWPESIVAYYGINRKHPAILAMYALEKWIYKKADRLVFTMEGGKDYIIEKGWDKQINLSKVHHINNGVDLAEFDQQSEHDYFHSEELDRSNCFKVVYAGSIRRVNNIEPLVDAANLSIVKENDIELFIFGDGDQRSALEEKVKKLGMSHVHFMGYVDKRYIPSIIKRSDLNIIHGEHTAITRFGSSPNKLFDYMASGKPILSDFYMAYDLLARYGCGVTIESQKPQAIAESILNFRDMSVEDRYEMGQNARRAAQDYDFPKLTDKLLKIIKELTV